MQNNGVLGRLYGVCDWIMKLAYVNVLWVVFSLAGLVILGTGPATVAMFTVIRKWLMKETDISIFKTFLETYKKEFVNGNKIGFLMLFIGIFLYFDFRYLVQMGGTGQFVLAIPFLMIAFFYTITLLFIFPVYVSYELKFFQYLKNAFIIAVINMHYSVLMIAGIILLSIVFTYVPGTIPFLGVVLVGLVSMTGSYMSFRRIESKQEKMAAQR